MDTWPARFCCLSSPAQRKKRNPSGELRHSLDLYANIRPAKTMPGIKSVVKEADLVIVLRKKIQKDFMPTGICFLDTAEWQITKKTLW